MSLTVRDKEVEYQSLINTDLLVLGSGPGGYTAAFRAADLGLSVVIVEERNTLGGVCLNVGCIPSKALLHCSKIMEDAKSANEMGIEFNKPFVHLYKLRDWKERLVSRLCKGLFDLSQERKIEVLTGKGEFMDAHHLKVSGEQIVRFNQAIIAVGSAPVRLPFFPEDPRIMDSSGALNIEEVPESLLVVGGGVIGMELATIYDSLGAKVTIVEADESLLSDYDHDLVQPLEKRIKTKYENVLLGTRVTQVIARNDGLYVSFEGENILKSQKYDRILVAIGREPNGKRINAEQAGIDVTDKGFILVDAQQRTNIPHIFAIGDVVGHPMLAHKASYEGKIAAEVVAGKNVINDARVIPAVAYTDPEIAWVGLTETEAKRDGITFRKALFPWAASGRAHSIGRMEGMTKILVNPDDHSLLGVGIVGPQAGELISEAALALEMGAEPGDIALTIHPHPTLSETLAFAAEAYEGKLTELYLGG